MSAFSAAELAYLAKDTKLGRLATVDSDEAPHVVAVGWNYNPETDTIAHVTTIPFENLDVLLRRRIDLDVEALQDKLIGRPRAGYCYEHTLLFAALLERLGFAVTPLAGRIRNDRDTHRPRSHAALRVEAEGQAWLADVGFGAERPLEPIRFAPGTTARQGDWTDRVDGIGNGEWVLRTLRPTGWFDLYSIDVAVAYPGERTTTPPPIQTHHSCPGSLPRTPPHAAGRRAAHHRRRRQHRAASRARCPARRGAPQHVRHRAGARRGDRTDRKHPMSSRQHRTIHRAHRTNREGNCE